MLQNAAVIAVDLPGHGESSKESGDYSLGAMASTLRDLLDLLGHVADMLILLGDQHIVVARIDELRRMSSAGV